MDNESLSPAPNISLSLSLAPNKHLIPNIALRHAIEVCVRIVSSRSNLSQCVCVCVISPRLSLGECVCVCVRARNNGSHSTLVGTTRRFGIVARRHDTHTHTLRTEDMSEAFNKLNCAHMHAARNCDGVCVLHGTCENRDHRLAHRDEALREEPRRPDCERLPRRERRGDRYGDRMDSSAAARDEPADHRPGHQAGQHPHRPPRRAGPRRFWHRGAHARRRASCRAASRGTFNYMSPSFASSFDPNNLGGIGTAADLRLDGLRTIVECRRA